MSVKHRYEYIKSYFTGFGYELVSDKYIDNQTKLIIKDKYNYFYNITYNHFLHGRRPRMIDIRNEFSICNIKTWLKLNNKKIELISEKYLGKDNYLKWKCLKEDCGEIYEMSWHNVLNGQNCSYCRGLKVGISNCLLTKNPELASEWHPTLNGKLTPHDVVLNSHKKAWWKCKVCGYEWEVKIANRNYNGCPECNKSKGEKRVKEFLIDNNFIEINQNQFDTLNDKDKYYKNYFIPQKAFDNLFGVGGGNLSYDFYLPKYNLLIEYQGEQHEKYIKWFHQSKKDFEKQVEHDIRKRQYALDNNIGLLEIWYYDFDRIEEILMKELKIEFKKVC